MSTEGHDMRKDIIAQIKYAGYHDDMKAAMRLYGENHISYRTFMKAFNDGKDAKIKGVKCTCSDCNRK